MVNAIATVAVDLAKFSVAPTPTMAKSKYSRKVLCSCGCAAYVSRRTRTRHLQGNGPTLALAEMFETQDYFGTTNRNDTGVIGSGEDTRPLKRRRIITPDPESSLAHQPTPPTPDLNAHSPPVASIINLDEVLASRWIGHNDVNNLDDDFNPEGHHVSRPGEVSNDESEESEISSDGWWDEGIEEDLLEALETNVELDACSAGLWDM